MRLLPSGMIIALSTMILAAGAQAQTFSVYDAFTGPLNPTLWNGSNQNTNPSVVSNTETSRAVVQPDPLLPNRYLQLSLRTGHPGTSNTGSAGEGRQILAVARDDILSGDPSVVGMKTRIVVTAMATPECPGPHTHQTQSRAQMIGFFFNDGSSTGPGDFTGDILVGIGLSQHSLDGKVIVAFMNRCPDATCSASARLKVVTFMRTWALNVSVPATIVWDRANNQFIYTAGTEVQTLTYGDLALSPAAPPALRLWDLRVSNIVANCLTPIRAAATARFDFLKLATESGVFP